MSNAISRAKEAAGQAAAELIKEGMLVGLGTGSTAHYFIKALGQRCREGLQIQAIASSEHSAVLAQEQKIPLLPANQVSYLDITIDGADQIDSQKRMIKGGGGALLREKILAFISKEMVVIIDSSKIVEQFGSFPLPVEIIPFAYQATIKKLDTFGYKGKLREKEGSPYVSDNGNYIFDVSLSGPCSTPEEDNQKIQSIPGVVETGFFSGLAGRVLIGFPDGRVEIRS
ncbi:ribose-5-phosphate isomerase RpiA [Parachlamydia sp. AcF125]|uniref:ribose-5-phosphate isomerase RpiA n=1 Tax=Parachlamydia sp. AcF125 TaxID=2795736 RepID=UPI001BC93766|nr:ribose-5-phosphate isomerase RpiA [Parachlamydia sp. AcF125]MBS4168525.1 Ribose-5-phosphate isomerase A [Parachlamydia sp. AcF125]